jgi:hypothetical protein
MALLREAVHQERPELQSDTWILHHNSAPAHNTISVHEFLAKKLIKSDHRIWHQAAFDYSRN